MLTYVSVDQFEEFRETERVFSSSDTKLFLYCAPDILESMLAEE